MKDLSKVDMKEIAQDWENRLTGKQYKGSPDKETPKLMPKPIRNVSSI